MQIKYIFILIYFTVILGGCTSNQGTYRLENGSGELIQKIHVEICGQEKSFSNIKPGDVVEGTYKVKGDCHFKINGAFKSGKPILKEDGYVTAGFDYKHEISVNDTDVIVKGEPVK